MDNQLKQLLTEFLSDLPAFVDHVSYVGEKDGDDLVNLIAECGYRIETRNAKKGFVNTAHIVLVRI